MPRGGESEDRNDAPRSQNALGAGLRRPAGCTEGGRWHRARHDRDVRQRGSGRSTQETQQLQTQTHLAGEPRSARGRQRAAAVSAGAVGGGEAASGDGRTGRTGTRTAYSGHLVNAVRHRDVTDGCRAPRPSLTKRAPSSRSRGPRSGRTVSSARKHGSINARRPKHSKALCTPQAHDTRHRRRERTGDFRDRGN